MGRYEIAKHLYKWLTYQTIVQGIDWGRMLISEMKVVLGLGGNN